MKSIKKRLGSALLGVIILLGLVNPTYAVDTNDFTFTISAKIEGNILTVEVDVGVAVSNPKEMGCFYCNFKVGNVDLGEPINACVLGQDAFVDGSVFYDGCPMMIWGKDHIGRTGSYILKYDISNTVISDSTYLDMTGDSLGYIAWDSTILYNSEILSSCTITKVSLENDSTLTDSNFNLPTENYLTTAGITITPSTSDLSFTVACDKACVAAIENSDGSYTPLTSTAEGDAYKFTANSADDKIVVAVKGDVSGDGAIDSDDYGPLVAKYLETGTLNSLQSLIGDINADGVIDSDDYGPLVAAYLETGTISW